MAKSSSRPRKRRNVEQAKVTLYDAVAGRAGVEGFLTEPKPSKHRDTISQNAGAAVPPEDVLFRQKGAPVRYEEDDIYNADRHLDPSKQQLPDSDLLKALHRYASDCYARVAEDGGEKDWRTLDETALLALGILIEEAAREALGETGDLALLEPAQEEG
ncbi:uncharacterized protein LTR77_002374 [Saxophila tyrrhenica]|uniref:Terminase small subunit n=1 Tax=Saxophila tyrrhenica TaxID=1690608 RepID=A0AAV9PN75_9PEZI|nr:hypothetical protein LTR77_002374 [Saxophila tyrrhenica]